MLLVAGHVVPAVRVVGIAVVYHFVYAVVRVFVGTKRGECVD